jgi:hypothetical protein
MTEYFCSACKQPTKPVLSYVGVSADCCVEAELLVEDEEVEFDPYGYRFVPYLRLLTRFEHDELMRDLFDEETAGWSPSQNAHFNAMHRP